MPGLSPPLTSCAAVVSEVVVDGVQCQWEQLNVLEQVVPQTETEVSARVYSTYHRAALAASDEGELQVLLPPPPPETSGQPQPVKIRVYYTVEDPVGGVHFITRHSTAYPNRANRIAH